MYWTIGLHEPVSHTDALGPPKGANSYYLPPSAKTCLFATPEIRAQATAGKPVALTIINTYLLSTWMGRCGALEEGDTFRHLDASQDPVTSRDRRDKSKKLGVSIPASTLSLARSTTSQLEELAASREEGTLVSVYAYAVEGGEEEILGYLRASSTTTVNSIKVGPRTILVQMCGESSAIHVVGRHTVAMCSQNTQDWLYGAVEAVMGHLGVVVDTSVSPEKPYVNGGLSHTPEHQREAGEFSSPSPNPHPTPPYTHSRTHTHAPCTLQVRGIRKSQSWWMLRGLSCLHASGRRDQ